MMHRRSAERYAVVAVFSALVLAACSDSGREPLKQTGDRPVARANAEPATQDYRNTESATAQQRHLSSDRGRAGDTAPNIIHPHQGMIFSRQVYESSYVCNPSRAS